MWNCANCTKKIRKSKEKYEERITRLCDFIESQDADIYAFSELENANILQDISNNLNSKSIKGGKYKYACFGKNQGGVFGCGIISKYPLENLKLHNIDFRNYENQPELRPILEVTAYDKNQEKFFFVCLSLEIKIWWGKRNRNLERFTGKFTC